MRFLLSIALGVAISTVTEAQDPSAATRREYGRGTVVIAGGERFEAENIVLARDTLTFSIKGSGQRQSYPLGRVDYASRVRTHARNGALVGGGLMLLSGLIAFVQIGADPNVETTDNAGIIVAGLTAGGALIGGLIGSALTDEKSFIQNGRILADLGFRGLTRRSAGHTERALIRISVPF